MTDRFLPYLLKRLSLGALTLLVILLTSYILMRLAPGDPSKSSILSAGAGDSAAEALSGDKSTL